MAVSVAGGAPRHRGHWRVAQPPSIHLDTALIVLACASLAGIATWVTIGPGDAAAHGAITGLAAPGMDLIAAVFLANAAARAEIRRIRLAWSLIALSLLVYAIGDALWAWFAIIQQQNIFPSAADVAYTSFYPIVAVGLLLFPAAALARREAARLTLDSAIVVVGGGMVVWQSLFRPALAAANPDPMTTLLTLGYPVGDLVLLFAVATIALRRPAGIEPRALVALVGGFALMFVADVAYGELTLAQLSEQTWVDLVYLASSLALAAAGYFQAHPRAASAADDSRALNRWLLIIPYAGLLAGYGVLLASAPGNVDGQLGELLIGAVVLTVLVLVRQELVLRQNATLLADSARRASEARFRSLETQASDAILLVDPKGLVAYASPTLERVLGVGDEAVLGRPLARLAHADDVGRLESLIADSAAGRPVGPLEWRLWGRDGTWRHVETVALNLLAEPAIGKIVLTTHDVREREVLKQQLTQIALRDLVTDLPNRALFRDRVDRALAGARRSGSATAMLLLDLDGFKRLNDSLGHAAGDQVLRETARRVSASIRAADTCARLGGDEFAVLLDGDASVVDAAEVAERIRAALRAPMSIDGTTLELTASIGIAVTGNGVEASEPRALVRDADVAMQVARNLGRDRVVVFEPSMQTALKGSFELESDLRLAVSAKQLVLEYQPIVDLATHELVGAEALVRWDHPTRGRLAPNEFIPLAEETGLIGEIGAWVLQTACLAVAQWARQARQRVPHVAVNLSALQLADPTLPWTVQAALAQAVAVPGWLTLEFTESLLVRDTVALLERLHAIRTLGVHFSIDDFGTGYSSLAYLQQFPISTIKIDRSFVTPLDDPDRPPGLASAVVAISQALGMATIAEGIETERQLERLRALGCPLGQGFLLSRPLDQAAMLALVAGSSSLSGRRIAA